jgi:large subunit ribosomal protein L24
MTQMKSKIRKGDKVIVISGDDKGKVGVVLRVYRLPNRQIKVLVEGVNIIKKHVKPNPQINEPGGIKQMEKPIIASRVQLFDEASRKGSKVGYRILEDGRKVRYLKSSNEILENEKH